MLTAAASSAISRKFSFTLTFAAATLQRSTKKETPQDTNGSLNFTANGPLDYQTISKPSEKFHDPSMTRIPLVSNISNSTPARLASHNNNSNHAVTSASSKNGTSSIMSIISHKSDAVQKITQHNTSTAAVTAKSTPSTQMPHGNFINDSASDGGTTNSTKSFPMTAFERTVAKVLQSIGCAMMLGILGSSMLLFFLLRDNSVERFLHVNEEVALLLLHALVLTMRDTVNNQVVQFQRCKS